jgi:fructose-1,6-bisphosphatase/inositol monophosphatase family enzyme
VGEGQLALLIDPLDGTRAFSSGLATSTTILGAYDSTEKQVVGCVVGEVATGRVWSAFGDSPTQLRHRKAVSVWPKPMDEQSTVFLDVSHGFARNHRVILSDAQMARLFGQLNGEFKLSIPGSNGLIQALVANGGQKVAGSITSAIGGPWDVCGVKLVLNAGGFAKAFHLGQDQDKCWLEERDPLNVMDYDILICGNELHTVLTLLEGLRRAL